MPETTMLHVIVDNADRYAEQAKVNGVTVNGPMNLHGERIYSRCSRNCSKARR